MVFVVAFRVVGVVWSRALLNFVEPFVKGGVVDGR